jgi:putative endonuclease
MAHQYHIYILASSQNTVLYTGVTNDLVRRVFEHRERSVESFTARYQVNKLVFFEAFGIFSTRSGEKSKSRQAPARRK